MATLTTVYATDEDVSVFAGDDYPLLVPPGQVVAKGTDGAIGAGNLWLLTSATVDFNAYGCKAGHVCLLSKPTSRYTPPGWRLGVASSSVSGLLLRRQQADTGVTGQPPAPAAGLTSVEFAALTLFPQIEAVSYRLNRLLGLDDTGRGISTASLFDRRELREACIYGVLADQYLHVMHLGDESDTFRRKHEMYRSRWEQASGTLTVRLNDSGGNQATVSRIGKLVR